MKTFDCTCGNTLYFENSQCLRCGRSLGFLPDLRVLCALEPAADETWRPLHATAGERRYRQCRNDVEHQTCNWMVPADDPQPYCASCRLNQVIPDLSAPRRLQLWYEVEKAKRRLLYTLDGLRLPLEGHADRPGGLAFQFLADARLDRNESVDRSECSDWTDERVSTGHHDGVITINLLEADPALREQMRESMNEAYRTLLGHFRHESGHHYWSLLFRSGRRLAAFRQLFGDERTSYAGALDAYYRDGPAPDWPRRTISAYASSHPWEDFAESWAHYLHMVDTLETASDSGFAIDGHTLHNPFDGAAPGERASFDRLLTDWLTLSQAMNLLNRSMGLADAYPFTYAGPVVDKLRFIHDVIHEPAANRR